MELKTYLKDKAKLVDNELVKLSAGKGLIETAMRYSLTAGGKRLRPALVICAAEICGSKAADVLPAACAVEFIHTYSLIHDDLPAMDNDDLRRGKPTSHKKFGEAAAILAGDALLTEAFGILAKCGLNKKIAQGNVLRAIEILSFEAGKCGMISGQVQDTLETHNWRKRSRKQAEKILKNIHLNKTAALIKASLKIGASLSGAGDRAIKHLEKYGEYIGLAFQITDDILDIEGNKILLGKRGSDKDNDKLTYPALYGVERSKLMADNLIKRAKNEIAVFGAKADMLNQLADYIVSRHN